jgi:hypothetical protein
MLIRVVLFLGVGMVLAAFGAAGWQYWQTMPTSVQVDVSDVEVVDAPEDGAEAPDLAKAAPAEDVADPGQAWLVSNTGGLVSRRDARAFLQQAKFVENRAVTMTVRVPLTSLLSQGEALPGAPYVEAFAEVRAAGAGAMICGPMVAAWAQGCVVSRAELVDGTYDPQTQTAEFRVGAVFTIKAEAEPLPDLSTRAFSTEFLRLDDGDAGVDSSTPQAFLAQVVALAGNTCAIEQAAGSPCRVMTVSVDWHAPDKADAQIQIGTLGPLPKGVFSAPPLF